MTLSFSVCLYTIIAYNLQRVEDIQSFLKDLPQYDDKKLYSLSLKVFILATTHFA